MWDLLHALGAADCSACGEAPAGEGPGLAAWVCATCAADLPSTAVPLRRPPELIAAGWCLGPYAGPAGKLVRRAKYAGDARALGTLGRWGAALLGPVEVDAIVPVPTPWHRRLTRGVDVPLLLARPLERTCRAPVRPALRRVDAGAQARLSRRERRRGGARFRATGPVQGRVLLVDDVLTTGGTARACATELLGAGAEEVWVYTVAAASPDLDKD